MGIRSKLALGAGALGLIVGLSGCGETKAKVSEQVVEIEKLPKLGLSDAVNAYTDLGEPIEIKDGVLSVNKDLGLNLELFLEESGFKYEIQGDETYFIKLDGYINFNLQYIYPGESDSFVLKVTNQKTGKVEELKFIIAVEAEAPEPEAPEPEASEEAPKEKENVILIEDKKDNSINTQTDNAPTITLIKAQNGDSNIKMTEGGTYIELGATASDFEDGDISKYIEITYLDGSNNAIDPLSIGSTVGHFRAVYTIIDEGGNKTEVIRYIEVKEMVNTNQAPTAKITGPTSVEKGKSIILDSNTSSDPEKGTLTYEWTDSTGKVLGTDPTYKYEGLTADTTETITLTVTDEGGLTNSTDHTITTTEAPAIASWNTITLENVEFYDTEEKTIVTDLSQFVENFNGQTFRINRIIGNMVEYIKIDGNKLYFDLNDKNYYTGEDNKFTITIIKPDGTEGATSEEMSVKINNG